MQPLDSQKASPYEAWRRRLYQMLEPTARESPGLSITNRFIAVLIILATALTILETEPVVRALAPHFFVTSEVVLALAFLVEYVARVIAAGEDPRYRGLAGRLRFMVSPWAIIDLLAILPFFLTMGAVNAFALRLLKLIRLLRLARLGRFSNAIGDLYSAVRGRRYELTVSLMVAVALLIVTSSVIYALEASHQPEAFGSIPRALWWSVATLTTVGYGDVTPVTAAGQLFAGLTAIVGIGMIAMPTGILAAAFSDAMQKRREQAENDNNE
ncbi:potassium channel family protein [Billgrantia aerodenitrificans]|uniref:Potassium channel family protein n=1 Tax=Billgrantia aerodenitrificans TaxID=2733483 RepID=A0ABS9ATN7_9GAMM|nr:ion transporter [Halomonas aerodenitrificans]MCE8025242.1 potassium channel family protein [Halomonas aerodenitrificans]